MVDLLQKYTNEHSRFLVIDGTLVHYRDEGEGFPLLLLHGAFSSLHTFDDWTEQLKSSFRVIRFDLIGFGLTGPCANNDYSIKNHKHHINTLLDMLKVEQCYIAGSSLGGWIAWECALENPHRFTKLVLIGAAGFLNDKSIPLPFKLARTPFLNHVVKYVVQKPILEQFLKQVYFDEKKVTRTLIDRYFDLFTRQGNPEAFLRLVNGKVKDNTRHLKEIRVPTLIQWGKHDRWQPLENAHHFHREIPNSELLIYEKAGHIPMEEIPSPTVRNAKTFLENHSL